MSCEAKTARPAVGVWQIPKSDDVGAPAGRALGDSVGGAEEDDDGLERLEAVWMEAAAEDNVSDASMVRTVTVAYTR
jgi:hypothetical protein